LNYAGLVRGAVSYGLTLAVTEEGVWDFINPQTLEENVELSGVKKSIVHNTVIFNVIATTLVYGSFMGMV
jgi:hypothetical protein